MSDMGPSGPAQGRPADGTGRGAEGSASAPAITPLRLLAVGVILLAAAVGWSVLGGSVRLRTDSADAELRAAVGGLWGERQTQVAPSFMGEERRPIEPLRSDVHAWFDLDQRRKGLLWYATYKIGFRAGYVLPAESGTASRTASLTFPLPSVDGVYDGFLIQAAGRDVPVRFGGGRALAEIPLSPGRETVVSVSYRTQGLDEWRYAPIADGVGAVRDLTLTMDTDFSEVDFPEGAVSPTSKRRTGEGWTLTWDYSSLISGRPMALVMPKPMNPGPLASRISFFAPVSLLFYFASLVLLTAMRKVRLHPVHYAFLAAGFFSFDLLFAYLVDRVDILAAFALSALASVALCVSYLRAVLRDARALAEVAISQSVFLVLFSYSFFFEGMTGLAIAVGSVVTLAYFMARTAHVDWDDVFRNPVRAQRPVAPPSFRTDGPAEHPGV